MEIPAASEQAVYSNKVRDYWKAGSNLPFLLQICGPAGRIPSELHRLLKPNCPYIKALELLLPESSSRVS